MNGISLSPVNRLIAVALLAGAAQSAGAVTVVDAVNHLRLDYDASTIGLFGIPDLSGGSVAWNRTTFDASASRNGTGPVSLSPLTSSTFAFTLTALDGYTLTSATLFESGSYTLTGTGTRVLVTGDLKVTPLPGTAVSTSSISTVDYRSGSGNWTASTPLVTLPLGTVQSLFSVHDQLFARVSGNGTANINKIASIAFSVAPPAPVPEPESYALMLAGGFVVAFVAWRRRARD